MGKAAPDPLVIVPQAFSPDRIMLWKHAARLLGVTSTPIPTFPVQIGGALIELASDDDVENAD